MHYDPSTHDSLTFHDRRGGFSEGSDSPRAYLERCLDVIAAREPAVQGWVVLNEAAAREAADASVKRYREGRPLSSIDGMPVGIKDLIETRDMPTQMGSAAYAGNFPKRDSAVVRALRDAGAIVLGKTVTTALGFLDPGPTTNPFDAQRTPGGSSSGSGAVVGANMVPVAIGSQLVGSVIRPASFSANWALKPTYGAINRGERQGFSQSHIGVHAGCATDMWRTSIEIVKRVGGDPGHPGLYETPRPRLPLKPERLAVFESEGWQRLDAASRHVFEEALQRLAAEGVRIIRRGDLPLLEDFEQAIAQAGTLSMRIIAWEHHWSLKNLAEQHPGTLGPSLVRQLDLGAGMTLDLYRQALLEREHARQRLAALTTQCDALIGLSSCGPAPLIAALQDTQQPTGDYSFSCVSSLLGAPAVSVPALSSEGMPLGIQVLAQAHADAQAVAIGRWLHATLTAAI
ncbi:amidase [Achromobacter sp.]|uniref:amidase n=1 Tax=Achromobacter sp. TaxID=134375 RepID=UPI003C70CC80